MQEPWATTLQWVNTVEICQKGKRGWKGVETSPYWHDAELLIRPCVYQARFSTKSWLHHTIAYLTWIHTRIYYMYIHIYLLARNWDSIYACKYNTSYIQKVNKVSTLGSRKFLLQYTNVCAYCWNKDFVFDENAGLCVARDFQ